MNSNAAQTVRKTGAPRRSHGATLREVPATPSSASNGTVPAPNIAIHAAPFTGLAVAEAASSAV